MGVNTGNPSVNHDSRHDNVHTPGSPGWRPDVTTRSGPPLKDLLRRRSWGVGRGPVRRCTLVQSSVVAKRGGPRRRRPLVPTGQGASRRHEVRRVAHGDAGLRDAPHAGDLSLAIVSSVGESIVQHARTVKSDLAATLPPATFGDCMQSPAHAPLAGA